MTASRTLLGRGSRHNRLPLGATMKKRDPVGSVLAAARPRGRVEKKTNEGTTGRGGEREASTRRDWPAASL